jgi:hypothetical protein
MSDTEAAATSPFEGNMFLYEQPVLLNKEEHGNLGLTKMERPLDFAKDIKGVPLVVGELQSAQKYYPLVFSDFETPVLIAMVGIIEDRNLFVDETGHWEKNTYVPSYLRCHPFALARRPSDEYAVVFDRSSQAVTESPDLPFFDGDEMSEGIQERIDFCGQYNQERKRTNEFCQKVKELGLLNGQRVTQTMPDGEEVKIADYVTIDSRKLNELDKDVLHELHQDGSLSAIYAQLFSLENWNRLIARRETLRGET